MCLTEISDAMKTHVRQPDRTIIISREGNSFHFKEHFGDEDADFSEHLGEQTEWEEKEKNPILHIKVSSIIEPSNDLLNHKKMMHIFVFEIIYSLENSVDLDQLKHADQIHAVFHPRNKSILIFSKHILYQTFWNNFYVSLLFESL